MEPPHLMISAYSENSDRELFTKACLTLHGDNWQSGGWVETVPSGTTFELRSDVGDVSRTEELRKDDFWSMVLSSSGDDWQPVRARFEKAGMSTIVELTFSSTPNRHPVAVSLSAADFAIPEQLWGPRESASARSCGQLARRVLSRLADAPGVVYGAIGVEYSLSAPSELGSRPAPDALYVSDRILTGSPNLRGRISEAYPDAVIETWSEGVFVAGWAPFGIIQEGHRIDEKGGRELMRALSSACDIEN